NLPQRCLERIRIRKRRKQTEEFAQTYLSSDRLYSLDNVSRNYTECRPPGSAGPCHKVYLAVNLTFAASEEGESDLPARHAERDGVKTTPMLSSFQGVDTRIIRIALAERKPPRPEPPSFKRRLTRILQNVVATENRNVVRGSG